MAEEENEQQARRRFGGGSPAGVPSDLPDERPISVPSQLDAILADRDTLLADRDDRDRDDGDRDDRGWDGRGWDGRGSDPSGYPNGPNDPGSRSSYDPPSYDRPPSYEQPPSYGERDWNEDPYRPSDPSGQLPQIHQPRRGDSSGRNEVVRPDEPLPPRRPGDTAPSGPDPADD